LSLVTFLSGSLDDFAGFKAARASMNALGTAADEGADGLKVGIEAAFGPVVGVAYAVAKLRAFAAYIAAFRHCCIPPMRNSL